MTDIQPITSTDQLERSSAPARTQVARQALADDLDTFLTLLTKQLQNQDPLQPMDTNQFVDQLTQFSELEQGVAQNDTLEEIAASLRSDDRRADIGLLGRVVEAETETIALTPGEGARLGYEITSPTSDAQMRIFDRSGRLVASFDVDGDVGTYQAGWDGRTLDGGTAQPGLYQAQVVATSDNGEARRAGRVFSGGEVREVRFEGGETRLLLESGLTVTSDQVRRVAIPAN